MSNNKDSVDDTISRLRGKRRYEVLFKERLVFALYVDTGIMLDVLVNPQQLLSFEREDYEYAKKLAINAAS
jgi:hypothetical protein